MTLQETHRYDDIIDLPHHQSYARPRMSAHQRAAQFMPFAALAGYDDVIARTAARVEQDHAAGLDLRAVGSDAGSDADDGEPQRQTAAEASDANDAGGVNDVGGANGANAAAEGVGGAARRR